MPKKALARQIKGSDLRTKGRRTSGKTLPTVVWFIQTPVNGQIRANSYLALSYTALVIRYRQ
jgi:hypothetical protein